jgi:hypothetical protein
LTKQRTMDPLLLIGSIIVLAAILTWILPAGQFDRKTDPQTHRTVVVPGSYKSVVRHPVGPWGTLVSIPQGLVEAGEVVFFVLLAGGALIFARASALKIRFAAGLAVDFAGMELVALPGEFTRDGRPGLRLIVFSGPAKSAFAFCSREICASISIIMSFVFMDPLASRI